mgnify:CR=1 FL=1
MPTTRVRLRFAKRGDLRLTSHHDLMRCVERMLRRAALPVAHTQGFNPRPKVVFPLALALGIAGEREVLELELSEPVVTHEVLERLAAVAPNGLTLFDAEELGPGRSTQVAAVCYAFPVPAERADACHSAVAAFLASAAWPHERHRPDKGRTLRIDLRRFATAVALGADNVLRFRLLMANDGSARPEEVVGALGLTDVLTQGATLTRTDVELAPPNPVPPPTTRSPDRPIAIDASTATAIANVPTTTTTTST